MKPASEIPRLQCHITRISYALASYSTSIKQNLMVEKRSTLRKRPTDSDAHCISLDLTSHIYAIHPQPQEPIPMRYPGLKQQIDRIGNSYSPDGQFARLMNPAWEIFEAFIASQHTADLTSLDEIPASLFAPFVAHCEASQMPDSQLFMVLAAVRTLLVLAGRDRHDLAGLVAPRKRKRVKNADSGTYQFEYVAKHAAVSPENVAEDTGSTNISRNDQFLHK